MRLYRCRKGQMPMLLHRNKMGGGFSVVSISTSGVSGLQLTIKRIMTDEEDQVLVNCFSGHLSGYIFCT